LHIDPISSEKADRIADLAWERDTGIALLFLRRSALPLTGDWKVPGTRRLESLRHIQSLRHITRRSADIPVCGFGRLSSRPSLPQAKVSSRGCGWNTVKAVMSKRAAPTTLLIATRNAHKVGEIHAILGAAFEFLTLNDFPRAPSAVEDAATFAGNATKKAVELARWLSSTQPSILNAQQSFVLADDSGLEVDALNGAPGVHSARFAALDTGRPGNSTDAENMAKLLRLLKEVPAVRRTARFHCVLALTPVPATQSRSNSPVCQADEFELLTELFDGVCEGRIGFEARGAGGFGYDPLFVPNGFEQTFAELGEATKNRLSHRAAALLKLEQWFSRRA
jgi:XTP/dITP diphosphohydrolase